jgi:hypothetical protein
MTAGASARAITPINRDYVLYLRSKLLRAEAGLAEMSEKYERVKARFDRGQARRGITPDYDVVNYVEVKSMNPELKFWYSKVEHYQREVAAYGATLTGLDAAWRLLGSGGYRTPDEHTRAPEDSQRLRQAS